ncbi:FAD-dependent oxidoreductase [Mycobacterium sp. 21AC1]|uniref:FAD-dependent oxidoreductase n=1 Tax=[Mycobacterium] appelbergii TaxID=2939269 RepID=UPI0029391916|nr:FAD-dependent oxidoreductase [Mycobacterium sp. 21AC1]MDV3123892.1 FAD-dependent oxidoreductase [Mycobacterium sp. 21AC1]
MTYVITQNCCNDASCIAVCPVGCIHPTPDEPGFGTAELLHIDPDTCIDCGACADACPVDAILPERKLSSDDQWYAKFNADYYQHNPITPDWQRRAPLPMVRIGAGGLWVAIVGSGAAGFYAAKALLRHPGVRVTMYERLSAPHGLIRYGVAPDHPGTKALADQFRLTPGEQKRFTLHLNVEVGVDVSHDELLADHHAVVYANGASDERLLDIPGEHLPGVIGAMSFVGWYNGHPDHAGLSPALTGRRAVVIGNGNVALDLARILTADPDALADTDIATGALASLRRSTIEDVVILGRRGAEHAAFTTPELYALSRIPGLDIVVDPADVPAGAGHKHQLLRELAGRPTTPGHKRIALRFNTVPVEIDGQDTVTGIRLSTGEYLPTGLVLRSIGFGGRVINGVPFDSATATIPTVKGRVTEGVYATGWVKRGPNGGIGTNRTCAEETVSTLLADYEHGRLTAPQFRAGKRRLRLWPARSKGA